MSTILATDIPRPADQRLPLYAIRWGAIFAGLAVGLSVHLLLMLLGVAGGLTALDVRDSAPDGSNAALIAGIWNTVSMLAAAFIGGYVAARASGLKRNSDGLLHGAVSWGATTIVTAVLATSAIGSAVGGAFSVLKPIVSNVASTATEQVASRAGIDTGTLGTLADQVRSGRRDEVVATLRDRFNLSDEQAGRVADGLVSMTGNDQSGQQGGASNPVSDAARGAANDPRVQEKAEKAMDTASAAMWWLFGAILASLIAGILGGALGVKAAANRFRTSRRPMHRTDMPRNDVPIRPDLRSDYPPPRHDGPIVR